MGFGLNVGEPECSPQRNVAQPIFRRKRRANGVLTSVRDEREHGDATRGRRQGGGVSRSERWSRGEATFRITRLILGQNRFPYSVVNEDGFSKMDSRVVQRVGILVFWGFQTSASLRSECSRGGGVAEGQNGAFGGVEPEAKRPSQVSDGSATPIAF